METYRSAFTKDNLMTGDISVDNSSYKTIGSYKVEAGQTIRIGWGDNSSQEGAEGRIYMNIKDSTNVNLDGKLRFVVLTPQKRHLRTLAEYRTETLRTVTDDRQKQIAFPFTNMPRLSEDKILSVEFLADATKTLSKTNSTITFDVEEGVV
jgi:hypothetical protein